ncbi:MAG TPA: hypothetical protein VII89_02485 [Candidatus Dormibacteraeota bacterium]
MSAWLSGALLVAMTRWDVVEPLIALMVAALFAVLLPIDKNRRELLRERSPQFQMLYVAALAALAAIAILLAHDWLFPSATFRAAAARVALTAGLVGLPLLLVAILRDNERTGVLADEQFRGLHGRAVIPVFGTAWCFVLGLWILTLFPHAPDGPVFAAFGAAGGFAILIVTVESFVQPRFLVPRTLRDQPGRVENWLAHRERGRRKGVVSRHRLAVPSLVTVTLVRHRAAGWKASSTDLEDLKAQGPTLDDLVEAIYRDVSARFAHPGGHGRALSLQYVCYGGRASGMNRKDVLFDIAGTAGDYAAESVEDAPVRFRGHTLDELMRTVEASGFSEPGLTWSRDVKL